ncbi:hypothetical protein [Streptomyces sp. NPDC020742]|uniref:hypothetical protein n=1 Tax=Streptomyces sp. NPDC020742 TaxID=3154897 RepID=UPI0033F98F19
MINSDSVTQPTGPKGSLSQWRRVRFLQGTWLNGVPWKVRTRDKPQAVDLGLSSEAGCGIDVSLAMTDTTLRHLSSYLEPER